MKAKRKVFRLNGAEALHLLALSVVLAGAPLAGAFAQADMTKPGVRMERDPPMGGAMPMEHHAPMGSAAPSHSGVPGPEDNTEMGGSGPPPQDTPPPTLPGFPGAPELYHMGATEFFLDHPEHVTLSASQQKALSAIRAKADEDQATYRVRIEKAENEVWSLTGAEQPDAAKLAETIREIEVLRGQQRMVYIQAVGEAAKVLTTDQREQLAGSTPPKPARNEQLPKSQ